MGESLRATLNELATVAPDWVLGVVSPDWFDRYVHRFELQRFPKGEEATNLQGRSEKIAGICFRRGWRPGPPKRANMPQSGALTAGVDPTFERVDGLVRWRDGPAVESAERVLSPYETDARASRKRETEWVGSRSSDRDLRGRREGASDLQAEITAATRQDVEQTMPLLDDLQARDLVPEVRLVDSSYVSGEVLGSCVGGRTGGAAQTGGRWQRETGYGLSALQVDWEQQQVRCPQGTSSQNWCPDDTTAARRWCR